MAIPSLQSYAVANSLAQGHVQAFSDNRTQGSDPAPLFSQPSPFELIRLLLSCSPPSNLAREQDT